MALNHTVNHTSNHNNLNNQWLRITQLVTPLITIITDNTLGTLITRLQTYILLGKFNSKDEGPHDSGLKHRSHNNWIKIN